MTDFEKDTVPDKKCQYSAAEFDKTVQNRSLSRRLVLAPTRQQTAGNELKLGHPQTD